MPEGERILIADDEETYLHSTAELLQKEGYRCDGAGNAGDALKMLGSRRYDLLIADIKMPGNEDLDFFKALSRRVKDLPVLLVTGQPSLAHDLEKRDLSIVACLPKPVEFDVLLAWVRQALFLPRIHEAVRGMQERLIGWRRDIRLVEEALLRAPAGGDVSLAIACMGISLRNNIALLGDLMDLTAGSVPSPPLPEFNRALRETAEALERVLSLFPNHELEATRRKLAGPDPLRD